MKQTEEEIWCKTQTAKMSNFALISDKLVQSQNNLDSAL